MFIDTRRGYFVVISTTDVQQFPQLLDANPYPTHTSQFAFARQSNGVQCSACRRRHGARGRRNPDDRYPTITTHSSRLLASG